MNDMGSKMELEKHQASSEWTDYSFMIVLLGDAAGTPNHQPDW